MKRLLSALVLCALFVAPAAAQEAAPPKTVRIGTWNIENFGGRRKGTRSDEDVAKMAAFIKNDLKVDVLAVQEINGAAPLKKLCAALGENYSFVIGSSGTFRDGSKRIAVGFLFNTDRVELLGAEELLEFPSNTPDGTWIFHRKPVVASFRAKDGGLDFRAVSVHLKAGRMNRGRRGERDSKKRQAEVTILGKHLTDLLKTENEDQDVVVLGDFNHDQSYPAYGVFKEHVRYLEPTQKSRSIIYFDEQIDHVAIAPGLEDELVEGSLKIHGALAAADEKAWRTSYSDHIPVTVELKAEVDGDPQASFTAPKEGQTLKVDAELAKAEEPAPESTLPAGIKRQSF